MTNLYEMNFGGNISILNVRSFFSVVYCKLIDRIMIGTRRFDERFQNSEDALFMFAISDRIKKICFTGKDVIYYRRMRKNSLSRSKRSILYKIKNYIKLNMAYTIIFFKNPFKYNFLFYVSRIFAGLKNIFIG
jgi:hypothetical protein